MVRIIQLGSVSGHLAANYCQGNKECSAQVAALLDEHVKALEAVGKTATSGQGKLV